MNRLSELLGQKINKHYSTLQESNIEKGHIFTYSVHHHNRFGIGCHGGCQLCWLSPGTGKAVIELWGAGGSAGKMCCCGAGIGGNPGAYVKKTISVDAATYIRGFVGVGCSMDWLNHKGCSEAACVYVCSPNGLLHGGLGNAYCICFCAEGGHGGWAMCQTDSATSLDCWMTKRNGKRCCGLAIPLAPADGGFCISPYIGWNDTGNGGCGTICNVGPMICPARAYGGDVNCNSGDTNDPNGNFSCMTLWCCHTQQCYVSWHQAVPPGIIGTDGAVITIHGECNSNHSTYTGGSAPSFLGNLSAAARHGSIGKPPGAMGCWTDNRACGCYEWFQCYFHMPAGIGAPGISTIPDVRDHGARGGSAKLRIKFISG